MTNNGFLAQLAAGEILISDGATGTNLQEMGLPIGTAPEVWVIENPDAIRALNQQFIRAGAEILLTCTFGGTCLRLRAAGLDEDFGVLNSRAVEITRGAARGTDVLVAGSIGPLGHRVTPHGDVSEAAAEGEFTAQAELLCAGGVDLIVIETMYDVNEASAAVSGVRHVDRDIPIVCSFSFDRDYRIWTGERIEDIAGIVGKMSVDVLGINCGCSPAENLEILGKLKKLTDKPIWFKPNAGLPKINEDGVPIYPVTPAEMGAAVPAWIEAGAQIVGGCCGSSPAHLAAISEQVNRWRTH